MHESTLAVALVCRLRKPGLHPTHSPLIPHLTTHPFPIPCQWHLVFDDLAWAKGVSSSILQRLQRKEGRGEELTTESDAGASAGDAESKED